MDNFSQRLSEVRSSLDRREGSRATLLLDRSHREEEIESLGKETKLYVQVRQLLELFVKSTEYKTREYIEPLVTEALAFVFDQGLKFHLIFMSRRNQVEVDFVVIRDSEVEELYQLCIKDPIKNVKKLEDIAKQGRNINFLYGGAVNQVISLVLRIVITELLKVKGPLILDEPTSAVGEEYSARVGQLVSSLSKKFDRQIILVTHSKTLASFADKIYEVEKINGISNAKEMAQ
jgi:DNA repair exonuclease SbcCD ATPase subunit